VERDLIRSTSHTGMAHAFSDPCLVIRHEPDQPKSLTGDSIGNINAIFLR
jgi:hypothetical protein